MTGKKVLVVSFFVIIVAMIIGSSLIFWQSMRLQSEIINLRADLVNARVQPCK